MATSGTIYGSCKDSSGSSSSKYDTWIYWKRNSNSITANTSNITIYVRVQRTDGYSGSAANLDKKPSVTLKVGGATKTATIDYINTRNSVVCTFATWTGNVSHAADGTLSLSLSCSWTMTGTSSLGSGSISGTATLDTIPRASSVSATNANIGSKTTIAISRASSSFTHTLTYSFEGLTGTIATKTTETSISWTVPTSFYAKIPNDPSGKCTITCDTYSGSTKIGTDTCEFTATASKTACAPSVSVEAVDTNTNVIALTGSNKRIVKGFSDVKVTTTATAKNSAEISSVSVTCGTSKKTGTSVTFSKAESATIKATVTDSRDYSNNATASGLTLVNYIVPTIVETISRESPTSDIVNISVKGKWFNGNFGVVANSLKVQVRYKPKSQSAYEDADKYVDMTVTTDGNTYTASVSLSGLVYTQAYSIRIRASDAVHVYEGPLADPIYRNTEISKGIPVFDWGEEDFNFNVPVTINGSPLFTVVHPVGFVCITSENEAPEAGSWTLLDKEFIPIHGSYDDNSYFTLGSASSCTFSFSRAHHTIYTRFTFTPTEDLSDSAITIGTVDIEKLGVTDLTYSKYAVGYSDGGGGVFMCTIGSTGALSVVDVVGTNSTIPAGSNCCVEFTHVVRHGSMLDAACNRFYWKRTL